MSDQLNGLIVLGSCAFVAVAYGIRVLARGTAHFERVDRQGSSAFLGKSLKEMGYWGIQPIGRLLVAARVTANQITWASLVFGLVSSVYLAKGLFGLASVFSLLAVLLDALDGMVARMTGQASPAGVVLDSTIDRYVEFLLISGLLIYYRSHTELQIICLLALFGSFMVSYSTAKAEAMHVNLPPGGMRRPERMTYFLFGSVLSSLSVPFEPLDSFGHPLGYPMIVALSIIAIFSNVTAVHRIAETARLVDASERDRRSGRKNVG